MTDVEFIPSSSSTKTKAKAIAGDDEKVKATSGKPLEAEQKMHRSGFFRHVGVAIAEYNSS